MFVLRFSKRSHRVHDNSVFEGAVCPKLDLFRQWTSPVYCSPTKPTTTTLGVARSHQSFLEAIKGDCSASRSSHLLAKIQVGERGGTVYTTVLHHFCNGVFTRTPLTTYRIQLSDFCTVCPKKMRRQRFGNLKNNVQWS